MARAGFELAERQPSKLNHGICRPWFPGPSRPSRQVSAICQICARLKDGTEAFAADLGHERLDNLSRHGFRSQTPSDNYKIRRIDFGKGSDSFVFDVGLN